jgi:[ribosomal protein S5]-alanine N-acetyltransferase
MIIQLRPLVNEDIATLTTLANNIKIWENLRDLLPHPYTEQDATDFVVYTQQEMPQLTFGITADGALCGVIGLVLATDIYRLGAEIGYWLGEPFWGQGIGSEAVRLMTEYGFDKLDIVRIYAGVMEHNPASMRVLEKNGFEKEGVFKKAMFKKGRIIDEHRFAKTI